MEPAARQKFMFRKLAAVVIAVGAVSFSMGQKPVVTLEELPDKIMSATKVEVDFRNSQNPGPVLLDAKEKFKLADLLARSKPSTAHVAVKERPLLQVVWVTLHHKGGETTVLGFSFAESESLLRIGHQKLTVPDNIKEVHSFLRRVQHDRVVREVGTR